MERQHIEATQVSDVDWKFLSGLAYKTRLRNVLEGYICIVLQAKSPSCFCNSVNGYPLYGLVLNTNEPV